MMLSLFFILLAILIILMNGFFVLGEFALVKVRHTRLQEIAKKGGYKERLMLNAHEHIDDYLSAIQIAITMTSLALGWVGEPSIGKILTWLLPTIIPLIPDTLMHIMSFGIAFFIITSLHVIYGEQVPKFLAIKYPEQVLKFIIVPLHYFYFMTRIFRKVLVWVAYKTLVIIKVNPYQEETPMTQEELRLMFSKSQEGGKFSLRRLMMFENLFDFEQVKVKEIMTPLTKISALKKSNTWLENLAIINKRKFSRYPFYTETIDDATEYVLIKEMSLDSLSEHSLQPIEERFTYKILNLDEYTPVETALREFQTKRTHQALIRDAKDKVIGLLTLEDVLEELVGEIRDEYEKPNTFLISNFFVPNACVLDIKSTEKNAVFEELVSALHKEYPIFSQKQAYDFILKRENIMSCALKKGIAFPHARVPALSEPMVTVGLSKKGIKFDSQVEPVKLFFLILTPFKEPAFQLKILAELANISSTKFVKERIVKAKTPAEIGEIFLAFENTIPD